MPSPGPSSAERLTFFMLKNVHRAVREFSMLQDGDRVMVALSGGKDSLGMLHLLRAYQRSSQVQFDLAAAHVLGDASGVVPVHPPLEDWLAHLAIPYRLVIPEVGAELELPLDCQRCTWLRRKALFGAAAELGCNVVAFAHHADDAAQTTLLNLLYGGVARTLRPVADYFDGTFRLIRPLFYVPESEMRRLSRECGFPSPPPACTRSGSTRRRTVAQMLSLLERDYPKQVRTNLIRAGLDGGPGCAGQDATP